MRILGEIFTRNARLYPDKPGMIFEGKIRTYKELNLRVNRLISAMTVKGIKKGDRVGILSKNCIEYWESYGMAEKSGIILVALNWRLAARELKHIINDAGIKALIVSQEYIPLTNSIREEISTIEHFICIEKSTVGYEFYEDILADGDEKEPVISHIDSNDIAYIIYSSGTTGLPKGIMLTHGGQLDNAKAQLAELGSTDNDIYLAVMPLFHSGGKAVTMVHFYRGCTIIIMEKFEPKEMLETIEKYKVTAMFVVPSMVAFILDYPDFKKYNISSLKTIFYAGSPMPLEILKRGIVEFGNCFCQGYGLTESGPVAAFLSKDDHITEGDLMLKKRLNSCGKDSLACEVRVVNEKGEDVKPGEVGEIIIRSARLMKGYWNQPEKTAQTIRDGWLYSGDMATIDEQRYIYIVDRKDDMIISGGENIYPREIEEVLYMHPAVLEATVIGIPDTKWGESIKAYISLKRGAVVNEEEIIEYCKQNIASYKKPKSIEFLPEMPKNSSGKIIKTFLREKYRVGREDKV